MTQFLLGLVGLQAELAARRYSHRLEDAWLIQDSPVPEPGFFRQARP